MMKIIRLFLLFSFILIFSLNSSSAGTIKLKWDAANNSDIVGYKVYYGYGSRKYDKAVDVGMSTDFTMPLPTIGTIYLAVTAYDTLGWESDYSNCRRKTVIHNVVLGEVFGLYQYGRELFWKHY